MTKDNIPVRKTYITLMLNTVFFKLSMLLFGVFVLIVNSSYVFDGPVIYSICYFIGFIVDLVIVLLGFIFLFKVSFVEYAYNKLSGFFKKFKVFRKRMKDDVIDRYKDEISFIKSHKMLVIFTFIITVIQRLALFSIIYIIYRALGYSEFSYLELLIIQLSVQIAIEAIPLPGGAGLSESMMHDIFLMIFTIEMADTGMLLTRTFTFYIPLIVSGLIILVQFLYNKKKDRKIEIVEIENEQL